MPPLPAGLPPRVTAIRLSTTLRFLRDPQRLMSGLAARYGDPFTMCDPSFGPVVFTGHPEGVREIFTADPDSFEIPQAALAAPFFGERSLLLQAGARHRAERRLLMPPFHGARMRLYGEVMREVALRHAADWRPGRALAVQDTTQAITLEVIARTVFGAEEPARRAEVCAVVREYIASWRPSIVLFPALRRPLLGLSPWARFQRAHARISELLFGEIDRRRAGGPGGAAGEDILALLVGARYEDGALMPREAIRDQLLTLLFAGHDTTAATLAWALYHLSQDAAARARLLAELATLGEEPAAEDLARLPFLDAVCQETLRLRPVVPHLVRMLRCPLRLRGFELPPGVGVAASILLAHRRAETYPDPGAFRPERFLGRSYTPFEFLPFGGGARRCLGAAFALYEMKIVLGALLPRYALRLRGERLPRLVLRSFTLGPEAGARMVLA